MSRAAHEMTRDRRCAVAIADPGDLEPQSEIYSDQKPASYALAGTMYRKTKAGAEAVYAVTGDGGHQ